MVEVHVVIAEQHLPLRAAVHEDDGRTLLAWATFFGTNSWLLNFKPSAAFSVTFCGFDVLRLRERRRERRIDDLRLAAAWHHAHRLRSLGVSGEHRHVFLRRDDGRGSSRSRSPS